MNIKDKLGKEILISDGGCGTLLQAAGLRPGEAPEKWNLTHPDVIIAMHKEYILAGADLVTMNTFGLSPFKYTESEMKEMAEAAFECAKRAASETGKEVFIGLDIGPTGKLLQPYGELPFEEAVEAFASVIRAASAAEPDYILIETMNDAYETKAALLAAKENSLLPVFVTNVYDAGGKLMTGADPGAMIALLEGMGADAVGMNCSLGPRQMLKLMPEFSRLSSTPIMVQPNAGLPKEENGRTVYDVDAEEFSEIMKEMVLGGATIIGGCCGTTPEYIRKTAKKVKGLPVASMTEKNITVVSSYTHAVYADDAPLLIGERINPTGKPKLKEALRAGDMAYLVSEAVSQEEKGAHILDVNVGLPDINEPDMMERAVKEIQAVTALPVQIDTVNVEAMERAMRVCNGKPLVNSVNGRKSVTDAVFPLVKKYGGAVIALTMDEKGIPETAEGRLAIAERIVAEAEKYGIKKNDIIVDPLALTVSSDPRGAEVTLEAIRLIKSRLGVHTSLGISNISFGLPKREMLTAAFYNMALEAGLDYAIMNPYSAEVMKTYYSWRALRRKDENFSDYIAFAGSTELSVSLSGVKTTDKNGGTDARDLKSAIIKGLKDKASALTAALISENVPPLSVITEHIVPALNEVGRGFEEKRIYLPGLLMSAESAKNAFDEVKKALPAGEKASSDKVILATVEGDIHDIGKNIVRVLLENFDFDVIDLGRDVPAEMVVEAAKNDSVRLVGLSALMTTTVPAMEKTIKLLRKEVPEAKVVVGGAVLTKEYAEMIGADKYAADAMETVRYAESIFGRSKT